jgi:tetratricopeptide (TPR) repeat protein
MLAASSAVGDRQKFLTLWSHADDFLWAAGRWRERISFGRDAERVAHTLKDSKAEATALFDAQARTLWHRNGTKHEAEALIGRAAAIAKTRGLKPLAATIEHYRSMMLLHVRDVPGALAAARAAVKLADEARNLEVRITARIALGSALREADHPDEALEMYAVASRLLENSADARAADTRAVLNRNLGRVYLRKGEYGNALKMLEQATDAFAQLGLVVQEAETAVYYAEALVRVGEPFTAERHLEWGRARLDPLGSVLRQQSIARVRQEIDHATRR